MLNEELWTADRFFTHLDKMLVEKNWTLNQLTSRMSTAPSLLYELRRKKYLPRLVTICEICDIFGISLFEFFVTEDELSDNTIYLIKAFKKLSRDEQKAVVEIVRVISKKHGF